MKYRSNRIRRAVEKARARGVTVTAIHYKTGIPKSTISAWTKDVKSKLKSRQCRPRIFDYTKARRMLSRGLRPFEVANLLGVNQETIRAFIKRDKQRKAQEDAR